MCGRFTLKTPVANWLADLFPNWNLDPVSAVENIPPSLTQPRFNIAPSQQILAVRTKDDGWTLGSEPQDQKPTVEKPFVIVCNHHHHRIECRRFKRP